MSTILPQLSHILADRTPIRVPVQTTDRWAAVAAVLRPGPRGDEVLFIRRAEHPSDPWSGHMAFPGGRRDPGDESLLDTARRETLEELGLDLSAEAPLLGSLDDLEAYARGRPTGLVIRPFVFRLEGAPTMTPNEEVAEVIWAPMAPLLSGAADTTRPYVLGGQTLHFPGWSVQGRVVWGLTYQMMQMMFSLIAAAETSR